MSLSLPFELLPRTGNLNVGPVSPLLDADRKGLTKKEVAADHPTWCPGCGDFSVLALYFKLIERRKLHHEKITTVAGRGDTGPTLRLPVRGRSSKGMERLIKS